MIHVFKCLDKNFIYDSGSGSLHECDAETAEYAKAKYEENSALPNLPSEKVEEIENDLATLKREGLFLKEEVKVYPPKSNEIKAH